MKVGILTIYGGANFGNKLQNYALQKFLINNNISSETIRYTMPSKKVKMSVIEKVNLYTRKYCKDGFIEFLWNIKQILDSKIHKRELLEKNLQRKVKFDNFENKNIKLSENKYLTKNELSEINKLYDYVIVGSDQVWNPFWQGSRDEFFLDFLPESKRVAYAPSIGVSNLPEEQNERYRNLLNGFRKLSCREIQGCNLIENLTNKECLHVCDPVFLLKPEEWENLIERKKQKYVVTYFLGGQSKETRDYIKQYAQKHDCGIIDLWSEKDYTSKFAGIEEFLEYIANAEMFFTDSFHGCAFAIIFKTQFVVCDRKTYDKEQRMESRIDSLVSLLKIDNRKLHEFKKYEHLIEFEMVHGELTKWTSCSQKYLLDCLMKEDVDVK